VRRKAITSRISASVRAGLPPGFPPKGGSPALR